MTFRKPAALTSAAVALAAGLLHSIHPASAQQFDLQPVEENHRTYLVNGLASAMPFIGYGFNHLKEKLSWAKHYAYMTPVEGRAVIQPSVYADIKREYQRDPSIKINLVGISYGGNIVTSLAAQLNRDGIPVNYLGVLDGPVLTPVPPNVHRVDNFVCRMPGCIGQRVRLAKGNSATIHQEFTFATSHVGLGDFEKVHDRILGQLTSYPLYVAGPPLVDPVMTASVTR